MSQPAPDAPRPTRPFFGGTPVSMAVLAVNLAVAVWVWRVSPGGDAADTEVLLRFGALERGLVGAGQWWRLLAAGFLHAGWPHLAANMVFGIPWCRQLERLLGHARFAGLYLASLLGASSLSLLGAAHVSVGASGALFGVIGAALAIHRRAQGSWGAFLRSPAARTVLLNLAILAAIGLVLPIDQLAHGGGLATGAAMGWLWTRPPPRRTAPWLAFALALLALTGAALWVCREDRARSEAESTAAEATYAAMRENDLPRARATLDAARARGLGSFSLDYLDGALLGMEGQLDEAIVRLRALRPRGTARQREQVDRALAGCLLALGRRLALPDGGDPARARSLLDEACRLGEAEACRARDALPPAK